MPPYEIDVALSNIPPGGSAVVNGRRVERSKSGGWCMELPDCRRYATDLLIAVDIVIRGY